MQCAQQKSDYHEKGNRSVTNYAVF
jgi:hypothetical protein